MNINIIDEFISSSITYIQNSINNNKKITKEKINLHFDKNIKTLSKSKSIINIVEELINISIDLFFYSFNIQKNKANINYTNSNQYIFKFSNIFVKINKLLELNNITTIFEKLDSDMQYFDVKKYINDIGEENINFIIKSKDKNGYLMYFIIYLFIYINDYRIKIFNIIEENLLKNSQSKTITYFTTDITKVDYSTILNSLPKNLKNKANDFYNLLFRIVNKNLTDYTLKQKKTILFSKCLIPVIEDFQRIHKKGTIQYKNLDTVTEKKEDIIVKKVLSDIRTKQDFYNNDKSKQNKTLFPSVLQDIQGVFYDEILELRILAKLDNKLMINNENMELYKLLENYRKYNFINFINNPNTILNFESNIPITAIRVSSIKNFYNQKNLHTRMIINDYSGDIVYFGLKHPHTKINDIQKIDFTDEFKTFDETSKLLQKLILNDKFYLKNKFTLFIVKIKNKDKLQINDYIEAVYNNYEQIIYSKVLKLINNYKKDFKSLYFFNQKLNQFYTNTHKFIKYSHFNYKIKTKIFEYFKNKIKEEDDEKENNIYLYNDKIKLPTMRNTNNNKICKVILNTVDEENVNQNDTDNFTSNFTCQHFISYNNLIKDRKNNPNKYNQKLFEFIKKFAIKSKTSFVCKSCNFQLNISVDITESFQAGGANILAINLTTQRPLEDLREYEKYNKSIKNIDKMVEKIASFYNFTNYLGSSINSKKNRNEITKEVIDFINIHNKTLRINNFNKRRQREKIANQKYGIISELSNYFLFKLDNDIFRFASDDTDKFKKIKINNIFIIIIFSFFIRLSYNIFINVPLNDKYCNYYFYEKFSKNIFSGLKIIKDLDGNKTPIIDYPNFTFYLFFMSCTLSKFGLWFPNEPATLDAKTIKSIVHTFVDMYNTIVEVVMKKQKSYIYEYFAGKILQVFKNVINKPEFLSFVKNKNMKRIKTSKDFKKIKFIKSRIPNVKLDGIVKFNKYQVSKYSYDYSILISKNKISKPVNLPRKFLESLIINYAQNLSKIYNKNGIKNKTENTTPLEFNFFQGTKFINTVFSKNKKFITNKAKVFYSKKSKLLEITSSELKNNINKLNDIIIKNLGDILKKNDISINISKFTYELTFNHQSIQLNKSIFINPEDIRYINKFNMDIMTFKLGKYFYVFNPNTLNYIGYYEKNKNIVIVSNKSNYLIPKYGNFEKLLYMGIEYMKHSYNKDEANNLIKNRLSNINYFITNFISKININKNSNPKLKNIKLKDSNDNYKYIFEEIISLQKKIYTKYTFTESKKQSLKNILDKSQEVNFLLNKFILSITKILEINKSSQTNICEFYVQNIETNFYKANKTLYNTPQIKFKLILESKTIIIGDIDTGIGFYGDTDLVEKLTDESISDEQKEEIKDQLQDEEEIKQGLDVEQFNDEEEGENMGDEDIQMGVGEV